MATRLIETVKDGDEYAFEILIDTMKRFDEDVDETNAYGETALHYACLFGRKKMVADLLSAGANPNAKDHLRYTPLHYAVIERKDEFIADLLLSKGANPDIKNAFFFSPRRISVEIGNEKALEAIERHKKGQE